MDLYFAWHLIAVYVYIELLLLRETTTVLLVEQLNWGLNKEMSTFLSGIIQNQSFLRLMVCLVIPEPEQTKLLNYLGDGPRGVRKRLQNRTGCSVIFLQQKVKEYIFARINFIGIVGLTFNISEDFPDVGGNATPRSCKIRS